MRMPWKSLTVRRSGSPVTINVARPSAAAAKYLSSSASTLNPLDLVVTGDELSQQNHIFKPEFWIDACADVLANFRESECPNRLFDDCWREHDRKRVLRVHRRRGCGCVRELLKT